MNLKKIKEHLRFKRMEKEDCPLCRLVKGDIKTRKYYSDGTCIVVDCLTCLLPMVVVNHHGQATEEERRLMANAIDYLFEYHSLTLPSSKERGFSGYALRNRIRLLPKGLPDPTNIFSCIVVPVM